MVDKRFLWLTGMSCQSGPGLSPMFEGLDRHADEMRGFQSTVMSQTLHLCIPDSASQSQAHALHRLRRRFSRLLLAQHAETQWMSSAMARRWSYFGHVLRQHSQHITMLGLSSLTAHSFVHLRPGPWNTPFTWLQSMAAVVGFCTSEHKPLFMSFVLGPLTVMLGLRDLLAFGNITIFLCLCIVHVPGRHGEMHSLRRYLGSLLYSLSRDIFRMNIT